MRGEKKKKLSGSLSENHILSEEMEKKRVRILVSQERFSGLEGVLFFCLFFVIIWMVGFGGGGVVTGSHRPSVCSRKEPQMEGSDTLLRRVGCPA